MLLHYGSQDQDAMVLPNAGNGSRTVLAGVSNEAE
jgi:hypothetical protein